MKLLPFISCKCITYGRVDTLVEALHSFLIQEYPADRCELIIVNDYPEQKLIFDHPQVTIYNLDETFPLIGEKENYAIERCNGDLIAVWDDDDVAMSNHLMNIANHWKEDTNIIHWETGVFYNEPSITAITGVGNSGDTTLTNRIHALGGKVDVKMPDHEASWFYMWGGRGYHQSGQGTDDEIKPNIIQRHSAWIESLRAKGEIPTGDINLVPAWKQDYKQMLKDYVSSS